MNILLSILAALLLTAPDVLSFDSISHDFGNQPKTVEYLEHEFTFTNVSGHAVSITYAVATCSCTRLNWTRGSIQPGGKGVVKATYIREREANSFEKFISVFVDGQSKPYVLRIAGSFHETDKSLSDDFPVSRSVIGFPSSPIEAGEAYRGELAYGSFWVANLSSEPVTLSFSDCSPSLTIVPDGQAIEPRSRARFYYEIPVDTLSWGRRLYHATPVLGEEPLQPVSFALIAIQNYSGLTREEVNAGPLPRVLGTADFGKVRAGQGASASFQVKNLSSSAVLSIRAVYSEIEGVEVDYPASVPPRETVTFTVTVAPSALTKGENTIKIGILTNSPFMQIMDAYITGKVE